MRYHSQADAALSGSSCERSRARSASAPGHRSTSAMSSGRPLSIAASVTPPRAGSYGRSSTGWSVARIAGVSNHAAAGWMWPRSASTI